MKKFVCLSLIFSIMFVFSSCGQMKNDLNTFAEAYAEYQKTVDENDYEYDANENSYNRNEADENYADSNELDNADDYEADNYNNYSTATSPKTIMDLFDGGRRIWFKVNLGDIDYADKVSTVMVTENGYVTEFYYLIHESRDDCESDIYPNPYSGKCCILSDFDGLTDDEILEKVKQSYASAEITYNLTIMNEPITIEKCDLPYKILYNGDLDNSGNNLRNEHLKFIELYITDGSQRVELDEYKEFSYEKTVMPIQILNKEYVGIDIFYYGYWITENKYASFNHLDYDSKYGVTEW